LWDVCPDNKSGIQERKRRKGVDAKAILLDLVPGTDQPSHPTAVEHPAPPIPQQLSYAAVAAGGITSLPIPQQALGAREWHIPPGDPNLLPFSDPHKTC